MVTLFKGRFPHGSERLKVAAFLAVPVLVILFFIAANTLTLGSLLRPAMSAEALAGWWGRVSTAVMGFMIAFGLFYVLLGLSRRAQSYIIWAGLALLAFSMFYSFDLSFAFIEKKLPFLVSRGVVTTLYVSAISITLAFIFALIGATAKLSGIGVLEGIGAFYTSYFRGTPLLVQLFLIYLGLPQIGVVVDPIPAAITALSLVYGAYMTEIFRSGIQSIGIGQWEAADALGLSRLRTFQLVILPQSMRVIVPPTGNQFIAMLKDSSLVSVVGVWDLMFVARTAGRSEFRILEMLITASVLYWIMSIVLELVQKKIEAHYAKSLVR
ncbi:amino acid ABC transporter permease [Sulfitobacter sp. F26204]|uniref:amino acid ABC transporter permease n=1 Tax=Sulfitobacter sp. F26204 TaxID=2996014 RepID=UPI00225E52EF|nr:amino acid ABC transporter permease [Sulfitobacter sp. F26204]MCX7561207.1 amino acid ABC transporter permease [Sulfitobacter sp. F26204]